MHLILFLNEIQWFIYLFITVTTISGQVTDLLCHWTVVYIFIYHSYNFGTLSGPIFKTFVQMPVGLQILRACALSFIVPLEVKLARKLYQLRSYLASLQKCFILKMNKEKLVGRHMLSLFACICKISSSLSPSSFYPSRFSLSQNSCKASFSSFIPDMKYSHSNLKHDHLMFQWHATIGV